MAIAMAIEGAIGVIARNQVAGGQAEEVAASRRPTCRPAPPSPNVDSHGRLARERRRRRRWDSVARAEALVRAGATPCVWTPAHGHTRNGFDALRRLSRPLSADVIDLVAGNVATAEGTAALVRGGREG